MTNRILSLFTDSILLRSQTSPVQARTMEKGKLPIRMIAPGRVFRSDEVDADAFSVLPSDRRLGY